MKDKIEDGLRRAKELEKRPIPTEEELKKEDEEFQKTAKKLDRLINGTKR